MSKTKQILAILFPNGIWYTYWPCGFILLIQFLFAAMTVFTGASDWFLFVDCLCIASALRSFYSTYKLRAQMRAHDEFMQGVFDAVRPQLETLHREAMQSAFNPASFLELSEQSCKIISAEVERRKNLARVSKIDKL
jgi:hypothetical protein